MVFTNKRCTNDIKIQIQNQQIENVQSIKFLGVLLTNNMDWRDHINKVTKNLASVNGLIYRSRDYIDLKSRISLYNGLALPHLTYCNAVWGGTYSSHLNPLCVMQKRVIRTINFAPKISHTKPLFKKQNSLTLEDINTLETLKVIHQLENNTIPDKLAGYKVKNKHFHSYNTRNKNNFTTKQFRNKKAQITSCIYKGTQNWNNLKQEIKETKNIKSFKQIVKNEIIKGYDC